MLRTGLPLAAALTAALICRSDDRRSAAVARVSPEAFAAEVKGDEKAAAAKYRGKVIEMTAPVQGINRNASGDVFLSLPSQTAGLLGVSCFLKDGRVFGKVVKGQEVTVRGRYPDLMFGVQIMDCQITRTGPSPALTYTAEQFAAEWAAGKVAAARKWQDKPIIVSGEVEGKRANDAGAVSVYLKAGAGRRVDCGISGFEKDLAARIRAGDRVRIVGEFAESQSTDAGPALRFCWPASD